MAHKHLLAKIIKPLPPVHEEELPHIGAGLLFLDNPTKYLASLRTKHGDTFAVDIFGFNLLMTFSPKGLEALYQYEEHQASFAMATFDMIGFKTPIETLIDTDSKLFYHLLMHKKMPGYVNTIATIVDQVTDDWSTHKELDIFDAVRTMEQRIGYALWIAEEAADQQYWPALKECFDALDQEKSFVDPALTLETIKTGKSKERAAVNKLYSLIPEIINAHDSNANRMFSGVDFFREHFRKNDIAEDKLEKKVIHNVMNANQGFLSNLYAGISWVIVNLLQHPNAMQKVQQEIEQQQAEYGEQFYQNIEALNAMTYFEQVTMESIRLAQRSLTLRKVMAPLEFNDGKTSYQVEQGVYLATMLSVTNTQSPTLSEFNPDNYDQNRLKADVTMYGKESVSTFGHGRHSCPAQRFSHHMSKIVLIKLIARFDLSAKFSKPPQPADKQMGGVSRPQEATFMTLKDKLARND